MKSPAERKKMQKSRKKKSKEELAKENSRTMKKKWENPEFRQEMTEKIQKRSQDPEYREKMSKTMKKAITAESREKMSTSKKKKFATDPEYVKQHIEMTRKTAKKRSQKMKNNWNDPEKAYNFIKGRSDHMNALDYVERKFGEEERWKLEEKLMRGN